MLEVDKEPGSQGHCSKRNSGKVSPAATEVIRLCLFSQSALANVTQLRKLWEKTFCWPSMGQMPGPRLEAGGPEE